MKSFDMEELAKNNGKGNGATWIAYQGKIYDVTNSRLWQGGTHMKRHQAGNDLTSEFQAAPHGTEVLERYPEIGELKKEQTFERKLPGIAGRLVKRFPMLRRHPHPMTVHFPIVFMFATAFFNLLYCFTGVESFATTAFHSLAAGIFFTGVAIGTGFYTWWLNYLSKPLRPVRIKQRLSIILLALEGIAFLWRLADPDVLPSLTGAGMVYLILTLSLFVLVTVIGWFGAELTFPIERG